VLYSVLALLVWWGERPVQDPESSKGGMFSVREILNKFRNTSSMLELKV